MSSSLILRPYQEKALDQIRRLYSTGTKHVLLHMATGAGKTVIFSTVMKGVQAKGNKCVLAVRGRELVDNASQRLLREGVEHGVMMANHKGWDPLLPIQVCSIDTLTARRNKMELPKADLMVIDEAHFAISPSFRWFINHYRESGAFSLSVTATPHVKQGLRHLADEVVYPITIKELIDQGYLVPPKYFAPPSGINLNNVRIDNRTGDYNISDLSKEVEKAHVTGDIITHYRKLADSRPAVLFACDVNHSKSMVAELNASGIPSLHIDANTPDDERKFALRSLEDGSIKIVSNVGILCTGVDMPYVSAIILARPTKSYNLFIQQIGRGTRPYQQKSNFIVLDHADNINEHGLIEYEKLCSLDGKSIENVRPQNVTCKVCYHVWNPSEQWREDNSELADLGKRGRDYICQGIIFNNGISGVCGHDNTPIKKERSSEIITAVDIELSEINNAHDAKEIKMQKYINRLIEKAILRGYKPMWIFYQLKDKYGESIARQKWNQIKSRIFPSRA
jgi:superfamily II DNA or RNA helicase